MIPAQNKYIIREFQIGDYQAITDIHNAVYPDEKMTVEETVTEDRGRDPRCQCRRWIGFLWKNAVAYGGYCQWIDTYHPKEFTLIGGVLSAYRNLGLGNALYSAVLNDLAKYESEILRYHSREDRLEGIKFIMDRGFREYMREQDWELDLQNIDPAFLKENTTNVQKDGFEIYSIDQLNHDENRDRKLYDLEYDLLEDVPDAGFSLT